MPLQSSTVWEVRASANDANGGGFVAGSGGTDYSQQDAAQVVYTDLVIGSTTSQLTSAAAPFTAAHVGNLLNLAGGGGFVAGRYQVVSVTGGVATMSDVVGTVGSTGGRGRLGGALASPATLAAAMVAGNRAFVRSGTYHLSAGVAFNLTSAGAPTQLIGYAATRGDITSTSANQVARPLLVADGALDAAISLAGNSWILRGLAVAPGTGTFNKGIYTSGYYTAIEGCKVSGFAQYGILSGGQGGAVLGCEVSGGATGCNGGIYAYSGQDLAGCWSHDNGGPGLISGAGGNLTGCIATNNTGDGIQVVSTGMVVNCTAWKNGGAGINLQLVFPGATLIRGNVLAENTGYGLTNTSATPMPADLSWDGNAYYANTAGGRHGLDDIAGAGATTPYASPLDVTLTADPFVAKASNDFRLNNAAGGGGACRAAAPSIGAFGTPTAAYLDMGAVQHQDAGAAPSGARRRPRPTLLGA